MRGARLVVGALAVASVGLSLSPAGASTFDIFGTSARDVAMGNAMTAAVEGYSAVYYNPAGLTTRRTRSVGLGVTLTMPSLDIARSRGGAEAGVDGRPSQTPESHVGLSLGWMKPIGGIFEERVVFGFGLYLPLGRMVRVQGLDPQTPHFYLYENLQDKLILNAALAFEPWEWLSLGLGVQVLADLNGGASLQLDIVNQRFAGRTMSVEVSPTASAVAGIHLRPIRPLWIGLSYRGSSALDFSLPVEVREGDALALDLQVNQTVLWSPHQLSLGVAWGFDDPQMRLALDATLAWWSAAPDPSPRLVVDIGGKLLEAYGLEDALDLSANTAPIDLGFSDTVTIRAGAEWIATDWLAVRGGYFFRPTPAPRQTGATTYLDNDAHVLSLGAGFALLSPFRDAVGLDARITSPVGAESSTLFIDVAAQVTVLSRRAVLRTDPNDPIGSLAHEGTIWSLRLDVSHAY